MTPLLIKHIHVTTVVLSGLLFLLRGLWMFTDSSLLTRRWVRIVPHIIDTVLLLSALTLAVMIQQYPFVHAWLTAKVIALLIYIVLGTVALKRGKTKTIRAIAFCAALITFAYIVLVALNHDPMPSLLSA